MSEHIAIYALASTVKTSTSSDEKKVRIDEVIGKDDVNLAQRFISLIPLCAFKEVDRNSSELFYSIFNLLAGISQILRFSSTEDRITRELQSLKLLRYYPLVKKEFVKAEGSVESREIAPLEYEGDEHLNNIEKLAKLIKDWAKEYKPNSVNKKDNSGSNLNIGTLPPYVLGRIATRLFSVSSRIKGKNLGDSMHKSIIAFLNACLIEESREIKDRIETNPNRKRLRDCSSLLNINYSNSVNDDKIFLSNIKIVKEFGWDYFPFTQWVKNCPLIYAFLKPGLIETNNGELHLKIPKADQFEKISVYAILEKVDVK